MSLGEEFDKALKEYKKEKLRLEASRVRQEIRAKNLLKPFFALIENLEIDQRLTYSGVEIEIRYYSPTPVAIRVHKTKVTKRFLRRDLIDDKMSVCYLEKSKKRYEENEAFLFFVQNIEGIMKALIDDRLEYIRSKTDEEESKEEVSCLRSTSS